MQYLSCLLWVIEDYALLSIVMISVSVSISCLNYLLLLGSMRKLRRMAKHEEMVGIGEMGEINSRELVPGDMLRVKNKS